MLLSSFSTLSGAIKKVFRLCLRDERLFKDFRGTTALHRIQRCTLRVQANDIRPIPCLDNGRTRRVLLPCRQRFSAYTQRWVQPRPDTALHLAAALWNPFAGLLVLFDV